MPGPVEIPVTTPGATDAATILERVAAALGSIASTAGSGTPQMEALAAAIAGNTASVNALSQSVAAMSGPVTQGATAVTALRDAHGRLHDEQGRYIAEAGTATQATTRLTEAADRSHYAWLTVSQRIGGVKLSVTELLGPMGGMVGRLGEVAIGAETAAHKLIELGTAIAGASAEADHLHRASQLTGLDFDHAAESSHRFVNETDAVTAAMRLQSAGIHLSQQELDALIQRAARFSQDTGKDMDQSIETLTGALITGNERGLRQFGGELVTVGGRTHTASERITALTRDVQHLGPATDDAASSIARFQHEGEVAFREFSDGVVKGATETTVLRDLLHDFAGDMSDVGHEARTMGQQVGEAIAAIAADAREAIGVLRIAAGAASMDITQVAAGAQGVWGGAQQHQDLQAPQVAGSQLLAPADPRHLLGTPGSAGAERQAQAQRAEDERLRQEGLRQRQHADDQSQQAYEDAALGLAAPGAHDREGRREADGHQWVVLNRDQQRTDRRNAAAERRAASAGARGERRSDSLALTTAAEQFRDNPDAVSAGGELDASFVRGIEQHAHAQAPELLRRYRHELTEKFTRMTASLAADARASAEEGITTAVAGHAAQREGTPRSLSQSLDQSTAIAHEAENRAALQRSIDADTTALARNEAIVRTSTGVTAAATLASTEAIRLRRELTREVHLANLADDQARLNTVADEATRERRLSLLENEANAQAALITSARTAQQQGIALTHSQTDALAHQVDTAHQLATAHDLIAEAIRREHEAALAAGSNAVERDKHQGNEQRLRSQQAQNEATQASLHANDDAARAEANRVKAQKELGSALTDTAKASATSAAQMIAHGQMTSKGIKEELHAQAQALEEKALLKALEWGAQAASDAAGIYTLPLVPGDLIAMAEWSALAGGAALGAAATASKASSAGAGAGAGGGSTAAPTGSGGSSGGGGGGGHTINLYIQGAVLGTMAELGSRIVAPALNAAGRQNGTTINAGVVRAA